MAILQIAAAEIAGIDRMVFHAGQGGGDALEAARRAIEALSGGATTSPGELIGRVASMGFEWVSATATDVPLHAKFCGSSSTPAMR